MTIARDNLRGNRFGFHAERLGHMFFNARVDIGECANRTGNCAGRDFFACSNQTGAAAFKFCISQCHFNTESDRLSMDTMAAADGDGVFMLKGAGFQRCQQLVEIGEQQIACAHQLYVEAGIENIRRSHALMNETAVRTNKFSQMGEECDDVMFGDGFDFINTGNNKFSRAAFFPNGFCGFFRDNADFSQRITGVSFNLKPDAELGFRRPDGNHFRAGIARDHVRFLKCIRRENR